MARRGDGSKASSGFIVEKWSCRGGVQQESWGPPATYRLRVDKEGGWKSPRKVINDRLALPR
jgi:hypothetical protein